jgi:ribosomal protein S12 methylthiotransferase
MISEINEIEWIRIMYLYPDEITQELISIIKENKKVCKYIDIPIQHINDNILKTMNRRGTGIQIRELINNFRNNIKEITVRSTIIVGFPGESEKDYEELKNFIMQTEFDRLGIFTYSKEEGTPASKLRKQVKSDIKQQRYKELMLLQKNISSKKNAFRVGKIYQTIVEGVSDDGIFYFGRTYAEAPEVDGKVYFTSQEPLKNGSFVNVKILIADEYDLTGEMVIEPS